MGKQKIRVTDIRVPASAQRRTRLQNAVGQVRGAKPCTLRCGVPTEVRRCSELLAIILIADYASE